jgi:hypothetical protein
MYWSCHLESFLVDSKLLMGSIPKNGLGTQSKILIVAWTRDRAIEIGRFEV